MMMKRIETLREKMDKLIKNGAPYEEIYKVSVELDQYIVKFYEKSAK